jgi:UDP-4-amino-4-deoxy-L-arabinose-oxoglutarate aminotransferase
MPTRSFVPFSRPTIEEDDIAEVVDTLRSGWLTSGPKVSRFEEAFRDRVGARNAIAVTSATAGLHILLRALDVGSGDEVIVPSMTWVSTANAVELVGATAVLADVDPSTLQLDPLEVERLASPRTKAVIPVHYAGEPADLDAIRERIAGREILLLEDAAHALGTTYKGEAIGGSPSLAAVFSFHPAKNITTGEGGMVVCEDDALARRLTLLRFHGLTRDAWRRHGTSLGPQYDVIEPGYKYNLTDLQAGLGLRQLAKLDRFIATRERLAARYDLLLRDLPGVNPLGRVAHPATHAWHLYVVRLDTGGLGVSRDRVISLMAGEQIGVGLHFHPLHLQEYYRSRYGYRPEDLPHAAKAGAEIISLPLHPLLCDEDQVRVVDALRRSLAGARRPDGEPVVAEHGR